MSKKIRHLYEKDLKRISHEEVTRALNGTPQLPHSDEIFDLDLIPMDVLDGGYVRYEPYNLAITLRHPLRRVSDRKMEMEEVKRIIISTYPIKEEQIIIRKGHDGIFAAILVSLVENNAEIIKDAMLKLT